MTRSCSRKRAESGNAPKRSAYAPSTIIDRLGPRARSGAGAAAGTLCESKPAADLRRCGGCRTNWSRELQLVLDTGSDLAELWKLNTPSWLCGPGPLQGVARLIERDDTITTELPPVSALDLRSDQVANRLIQLRRFSEALPYARRALAKVSTSMIFDDHEITDDWNVSRKWIDGIRDEKLRPDHELPA